MLIICPSSARYNWEAEIHGLLVEPKCIKRRDVAVVGSAAQSLIIDGERKLRFVIISYNLVQKMTAKLNEMNFNVIVCDECHYLKNGKAKRTKCIVPMLQKAKRAIMISGTPALSRPIELFTQLNALNRLSWPDEKEFGKRSCKVEKKSAGSGSKGGGYGNAEFKGASNTKELHVLLTNTIMIRRLKKDILLGLPPKERSVVKLNVTDPTKREELRLVS